MWQEVQQGADKKKHRFGALALLFPIIYTLIDFFSIAEISGFHTGNSIATAETTASIPAIDFFIFECAGFVLVAMCVWFYMAIVKKHIYNPFQEDELIRCGAATAETAGTMAFIFASAINPALTAPVVSSYCLVTIVLARIFLKERLTRKQYLSLVFVITGIALLGVSEFLSV